MKSVLLGALSALAIVASGMAQTTPVYKNFGSLVDPLPPIVATTVDNYGSIQSGASTGPLFTTDNTLTFINEVTGYIGVAPGVQFDFSTNGFRYPSMLFSNRGTVYGSQNVIIKATNVVSTGPTASLQSTKDGKVHIEGQAVNVFQSSISAGSGSSGAGSFSEGSFNDANGRYTLPSNATDEYWGAGTSGNMDLNQLNNGGKSSSSYPITLRGSFGSTSSASIDLGNSYSFYYRYSFTRINGTSLRGNMQLVFINTNLVNEPGVQVLFNNSTNSNGFSSFDAMIEFSRVAVDPITQQPYTNYLYLRDRTATRAQFSVGAIGHIPTEYVNAQYPGRYRPDSYRLDWTTTQAGTNYVTATNFDSRLIYTPTGGTGRFSTNLVTQTYAAYGFTISPFSVDGTGLPPTVNTLTNAAGRVEISANTLNMGLAKIQAENLIQIVATNLQNTGGAPTLDAPNLSLQLKSTSSNVVLSNMFPSQVNRLAGSVDVWSGIWTVQQFVTNGITNWLSDPQIDNGTNTIDWTYHMLVVDNTLTTNQAVYARNLVLNSTNSVTLATGGVTVDGTFHSDSQALTIGTNAFLAVANTNPDLNAGNLPNLLYLTNYGLISVSGTGSFGADRPNPYAAIVNYGTFQQGSLQFWSDYFENSGVVQSIGSFASLKIDAATNYLKGGTLLGLNGVELDGGILQATNTIISTAGLLQFGVTNLFTDLDITNNWFTTEGVSITAKPTKGDLLSTSLTVQAGSGVTTLVDWLAQDRGDTPPGYVNNLALGRLVLNGTASSGRFYITSLNGVNSAMYIDTIDLQNYATNYATQIIVDPNITVYFANTSTNIAPDKLTNAFGGRFVWVSTNTYSASAVTVQVGSNTWATMSARDYTRFLANNGNVATPNATSGSTGASTNTFAISQVVVQDVQLSPNQPAVKMAFISWQGVAGTTYYIESKATLNSAWTVVASLPCNTSGPMTYGDTLGTKDTALYRVRYQPGN